jgi:hypothetical protein
MARKSTNKVKDDTGEAYSPQQLGKLTEIKRAASIEELRNLASKFLVGTRVSRSVWVKDSTNPLLLVKGYKSGTIRGNMVNPNSGYPTLLVLWDGDNVPVTEHPPILTIIEDW